MARKDVSTFVVLKTVQENPPCGVIQALAEKTGQCEKVCVRALERDGKLIEYGVSINRPWLTPEGEAWLKANTP